MDFFLKFKSGTCRRHDRRGGKTEEREMPWLPEILIGEIISLTTPLDACRLAAVSRTWRSASDSDEVWERFLPPHYGEILTEAINPVEYSSKKEVFFRLCESILVDGGNKIFSLKCSSGKVSIILSPRTLDVHYNWNMIPTSELSLELWDELQIDGEPPHVFRFREIALLSDSVMIDIIMMIPHKMLSAKAYYSVRLVFRIRSDPFEGLQFFLQAGIMLHLDWRCKRVMLDSEVANIREDGWMELEIGQFFNDFGEEDEEVYFTMAEEMRQGKGGLILEGFELCPLN